VKYGAITTFVESASGVMVADVLKKCFELAFMRESFT
jgi:hypothetical protein